jgi:hypothetical protein
LSSGIQRLAAVGNHLGGQRDVSGHDQVSCSDVLSDGVISDVEPGRDLEHLKSLD